MPLLCNSMTCRVCIFNLLFVERQETIEEPVRYPIDDLLVKYGANDPFFADCPSPCRDFMIPIDCVGDLLIVWDFCSLFGRVLKLWPFPLEDFEKAVCHKDGPILIMIETHCALLNVFVKDDDVYEMVTRSKKRSSKARSLFLFSLNHITFSQTYLTISHTVQVIFCFLFVSFVFQITLTNWNEYLCDFLECKPDFQLSSHISMIKQGHYGLLDIPIKLRIHHHMVNEVVFTDAIRNKIDEYHKGRQVPAAARRELAQFKRVVANNTLSIEFCSDELVTTQ